LVPAVITLLIRPNSGTLLRGQELQSVPRGPQDAKSTVGAVRCGLTAAGLVVRETFGNGAAQTGQHLDTSAKSCNV
jgi:hypothetical protein